MRAVSDTAFFRIVLKLPGSLSKNTVYQQTLSKEGLPNADGVHPDTATA
jgi:hypothetical protein